MFFFENSEIIISGSGEIIPDSRVMSFFNYCDVGGTGMCRPSGCTFRGHVFSFLPMFPVCVLSGMLFNLIVSYVFPQGIQSQGFFLSYLMFYFRPNFFRCGNGKSWKQWPNKFYVTYVLIFTTLCVQSEENEYT